MRKSRDLPDIRTQTRNTRYIRPGSDVCACFCPLTSQNNPERNSLSSRMRCRAKLRPDTCSPSQECSPPLPDRKAFRFTTQNGEIGQDRKMPRLTVETGWRIASRPDNGFQVLARDFHFRVIGPAAPPQFENCFKRIILSAHFNYHAFAEQRLPFLSYSFL